jgi:hypothetical protein
MTSKKLHPGGEVDAYCTKCKLDLGHRIIAMHGDLPKKVECMTCRSHHMYRRPKSAAAEPKAAKAAKSTSSGSGAPRTGSSASAKAVAAAAAENAREKHWEKVVAGKPVTAFKGYRVSVSFNDGDLLRHSKFGDGFVVRVIDKNKMEVMFKEGPRTLAHGMEAPVA